MRHSKIHVEQYRLALLSKKLHLVHGVGFRSRAAILVLGLIFEPDRRLRLWTIWRRGLSDRRQKDKRETERLCGPTEVGSCFLLPLLGTRDFLAPAMRSILAADSITASVTLAQFERRFVITTHSQHLISITLRCGSASYSTFQTKVAVRLLLHNGKSTLGSKSPPQGEENGASLCNRL